MNTFFKRVLDALGADHNGDDYYSYSSDANFGPVTTSRVADRWVRTTCGYCSVGCGMLIGVRDGKAVAAKGDPDHPVNRGRLCPKGLAEHLTLAAPGRLTHPSIDGEQVSWADALDHVVTGFQALMEKHGPEAVAVVSTGQLVTEEFYALGKLVRLGFGIQHFDGNTTLCMASAVSGYKLSFGSDGPPGSYDDFTEADVIMLVGANVADNHPLLVPRVIENDNAEVIVVDPRVTKTAMLADQHLAVRPRSDVSLLNGIIKVLLDEGLVDLARVRQVADGLDELVEHVQSFDLAHVAADCGVPAEQIRRAALTIGRAERAMVAWTMGVNHSTQGTETVTLLNTLCVLTGNIGKPGSAPLSITGQCNAMGTRETGFTANMPGYRAYDDPEARRDLAVRWGIDEARLPAARGRAYPDIINGIIDGQIKGLWVIGTNPVVSFPNRDLLEYALGQLDLLVVQDGFENPTSVLADVVLPAAIWGEKDGTYTNSERRVSRVRKAVDPPGEAWPDFDIFLALADRLGVRDELFAAWATPQDAYEEWRMVSAGRLCDYSEIDYGRIDAEGGVQWPAGLPRLYSDWKFPTTSGRAQLRCVTPKPLTDAPRERFPLLLNTGRTVEHWHTRTKTGRVEVLEQLAPAGWVEVHPDDAVRHHIGSGSVVRIVSERGVIERVRARLTRTVRPGEVFVPFHFDEACANRLTLNEFDPISREPNYKQCAVRLEPI